VKPLMGILISYLRNYMRVLYNNHSNPINIVWEYATLREIELSELTLLNALLREKLGCPILMVDQELAGEELYSTELMNNNLVMNYVEIKEYHFK
jgi:hypothetical protein